MTGVEINSIEAGENKLDSSSAPNQTWIALLGRRDAPTDGVEDYCTFLGRSLAAEGIELKQAHVLWMENGWPAALRQLSRDCAAWRGKWVLLQYTALMWSRRGFPFGVLRAVARLQRAGARVAVVFHESRRHGGGRPVDRLRGACQDWIVRQLYKRSAKSIFTVPLETLAWMPKAQTKAAFIPIGANIPEPARADERSGQDGFATRTVAAFCVSSGEYRFGEAAELVQVVRRVHSANAPARLLLVGRGTEEVGAEIEKGLAGSGIEFSILGNVSAEQISQALSTAGVLIFVRGLVAMTRGSAMVGIACGLPIVGFAGGVDESSPLTEAGLVLVPFRDRDALADAAARVMADSELWASLCARSRSAQDKYFSWQAIADRFIAELQNGARVPKPSEARVSR